MALLCLHFGRLPEDIAGEEYIGYYNLLLERNASGSHMRHAVFSVRKYFRLFGLSFPLGSNPPIPKPKTLPTVLSVPEMRELLNNNWRYVRISFWAHFMTQAFVKVRS